MCLSTHSDSARLGKTHPRNNHSPLGPRMVDTHSKMLSPLGPAEQLHGGSSEISASSLEMRLAAEDAMCGLWASRGRVKRGSRFAVCVLELSVCAKAKERARFSFFIFYFIFARDGRSATRTRPGHGAGW